MIFELVREQIFEELPAAEIVKVLVTHYARPAAGKN